MLERYCTDVFVSCNAVQLPLIDSRYRTLKDLDIYADNGPATGVLTAFDKFPADDFLVIGCDYPFLSETDIGNFLKSIPEDSVAGAFYDQDARCYQPVLAWYSSTTGALLKQAGSLKQLLENVDAFKYIPVKSVRSIDTKQESDEVMNEINYNY